MSATLHLGPRPAVRRVTMDDYLALLCRAMADLRPDDAESRQAVYGRARRALEGTLRAPDHAVSEREIEVQTSTLEGAIACLEARCRSEARRACRPDADVLASAPADTGLPQVAAGTEAGLRSGGRRRFAANAAASAVVSLFKTCLQVAMLPLMARLLGPTAYGIYALAFPTVMFFVMLADAGLGVSLAREDENNRIVWSTAFWTLLGTCSALALGVFGSGFVLARISGQPSLVGIMGLLAVAPLLLALMLPADARLVRRGNLLWHSGSDFVASVIGAGVALILAFHGAGAWSLAAQYIASFTVRAAILNAAAWSPPAFEYDFSTLRGHLSTGGALLIGRFGELGGKLAENAIFGQVFGTAPLGAYTLANQVARFANDAVANPALGAFYAQILHESDAQVAALHARVVRTVLTVLLPATAMMAVAAPDVFPILLGPQWHEAAPVFRAIVVCYALSATAWLGGQVMVKHGLTDRIAKVSIGSSVARVGTVALGLWLSPVAVAWLVGATYAFQAVAMTLAVPAGLGAGIGTLCRALWAPAAAAAAAAAVASAVIARAPGNLPWAIAAAAVGGITYLALLAVLDGQGFRSDMRGLTLMMRRAA